MAKLSANGTEVARLIARRQDKDADQTLVQVYSLRSNGVVLRRAGTTNSRGHWKHTSYRWSNDAEKASTNLAEILRGRGYDVTQEAL
jgi:folate-dependent phosphoribosylglycinamide formyltransferase PurN